MVEIDRCRCGFCGGCVSVCPVGAIELAETELLIEDTCFDCGLCVAACPVGALREGVKRSGEASLGRRYDVVVIGAGPAGSTAARVAAQKGLSVLLLEKRQEIGSPVRCAEGIGHDQLVPFIEPDPRWISAMVDKARITTVHAGREETLEAGGARGCILERRVFDRVLAEEAVRAGAQVLVKAAAKGLVMEDGAVKGVLVEHQGKGFEVEAGIVIGADGVESKVGRWAGIDTTLPLKDTMVCAQYLLAGIDIDPTCLHCYLGEEIAPGGYAWAFPKGEAVANVGLGVQADIAALPALDYLDRFIEGRSFLARGSPVTLILGDVPVALPPQNVIVDGCMLIGDAARQVDPLTGGGIANAMRAGLYAAEVAAKAIEAADASARLLSEYQRRWQAAMGRKMARNYRLKERFSGEERISRRFIHLFSLAVAG